MPNLSYLYFSPPAHGEAGSKRMRVELLKYLAQFGLEIGPNHVVGDERAETELHGTEPTQELDE